GTTFSNVITGISTQDQWQHLVFDLNAFAGQSIIVEISYVTDPAVGGFGMVVDNLVISANGSTVFENDADSKADVVSLDGFIKIGAYQLLEPKQYYIQLRSQNGIDS
ncbi:MAG: immune inhibitor A, partial [Gammaproteobacteria bacterium]|nr:immune inhibitor A [Gammaproteobacteria bacterium]